ncbi:MucB/RseB C-terminal domain-containing protein [Pseudomonas lalucatii]|uniref:MucB/RseB C-terminal domain-containing protein n=1 Tax=Pseudomonas lalucatii TaxID=1424203 RepID=A0ABS5PZK8_9PSED|nr:MucB/RseB C-terminal domain-containing protein [Pseudomonas lalucatii]MBS7661531.1 MucB/RseB C-terminal domain-containing protein [Pseudomonas lalucatii]
MRFIPLSLFLCGGWAMSAFAAEDAQDWLQRLAEAERSQSFQGTFVYERNGSFSTHGIWQRVEDGDVRERLLQLDGPAQEVLRVNGRAQCVSGTLADQVVGAQAWPAREIDVEQLEQWYELRMMGASRVAGRAAVVLALVPRDQHRYGVELHLDRESGLPLKTLLLNDKGQLLERFQFTRLDISTPPDAAALRPSTDCQPVRLSEAVANGAGAWRADWLPPGFTLSTVSRRRSPVSDEAVACLMYDDGVARFSVFLEPLQGAAVGDARSQLGPTVAVSRRMATSDGDVMVTVVGEIPLGTAERVALSMRSEHAQVVQ